MTLFSIAYWKHQSWIKIFVEWRKKWIHWLSTCTGTKQVGVQIWRIRMIRKPAYSHITCATYVDLQRFSSIPHKTVKVYWKQKVKNLLGNSALTVFFARRVTRQLKNSTIHIFIKGRIVMVNAAKNRKYVHSITAL